MTTQSLTQLLTVARRHLDRLRRSQGREQVGAVEDLMEDAYRLGRAFRTDPKLLSDPDWRRFLDEAAPVVCEHFVRVSYHPSELVLRFEGGFESDEWVRLCIARSELQFFIDLFRDSAIGEDVAAIDTNEIDELIRMKEDEAYVPPGKLPPEIPASHWWWWFPQDPPTNRR